MIRWRALWNCFWALFAWGFLGWYLHEAVTTGSGRFAVYAGVMFPVAVWWLAKMLAAAGKDGGR